MRLERSSKSNRGEKKIREACKPGSVAETRCEPNPGGQSFIWDRDCPRPQAIYPNVGVSSFDAFVCTNSLCWILLQMGFAKRRKSPSALVGSYPTVSPLPDDLHRQAVCFLLHFP
jgi:hypothetical protein